LILLFNLRSYFILYDFIGCLRLPETARDSSKC